MDRLRCFVVSILVLLGACHTTAENYDLGFGRVYGETTYPNVTRIIGGHPVNVPIPYQISLQIWARTNWKHICGGSIIGKKHILTAAHCVYKVIPERMSIVAGTANWRSGGVRHRVATYRVHPKYQNKKLLINDLAILKLTSSLSLNGRTINTIRLSEPSGSKVENNYPVTLTGWGSISPGQGRTPDRLMFLNYNTISNKQCRRRGFAVTSNEICTFLGRNRGACVGDSGGPLVNRDRTIQIGVVSYGSATCAIGYPDVFTRVSNFLPWIRRVVQSEIP